MTKPFILEITSIIKYFGMDVECFALTNSISIKVSIAEHLNALQYKTI
jgi:hypothetical protein